MPPILACSNGARLAFVDPEESGQRGDPNDARKLEGGLDAVIGRRRAEPPVAKPREKLTAKAASSGCQQTGALGPKVNLTLARHSVRASATGKSTCSERLWRARLPYLHPQHHSNLPSLSGESGTPLHNLSPAYTSIDFRGVNLAGGLSIL